LIGSDADTYERLRTHAVDRSAGEGCCGGGAPCAAGPPACVLLLEITEACNLRCPTCYADAHGHEMMSIETVRHRLDTFFAGQPKLDVLMLSGGEPTIHPRFVEILDLALEYPIDRVVINTNGLRLVQSSELVNALSERKERIELYFSFASLRREVHLRLYGKDLVEPKLEALRVAGEAGLFVNLVPTVEAGVNDQEIGDLYRFALAHPTICGITYQPVMANGRYEHGYAPEARLTLTGVLGHLVAQTNGALALEDFVALPCSHPDCCALTYGILSADRATLHPFPRHLDIGRYLDLFADRISFAGVLEGAVRRVWSDLANLHAKQTLQDLWTLYRHSGLKDLLPLRNDPAEVGRRTFRVVVKPFMDAHTFDARRVDQCCTRILDADGQARSFCEFNILHRGRAARSRRGRPLTMVEP
ncbi:MAG: radical SAM protein, partial [Armatimonadota bacterium]